MDCTCKCECLVARRRLSITAVLLQDLIPNHAIKWMVNQTYPLED